MKKQLKILLVLIIYFSAFLSFGKSADNMKNESPLSKETENYTKVEHVIGQYDLQVNALKGGIFKKISKWVTDLWHDIIGKNYGEYNEGSTTFAHPMTTFDRKAFPTNQKIINHIFDKLNYDNKHFANIYKSIFNYALTGDIVNCTTESGVCTRAIIGKDAAFCYFLRIKVDGQNISLLTAAQRETDDDMTTLKTRAINALKYMNTEVPTINSNVDWRSKELVLYAQTYDLLKGAGVSDNELEKGRENLKKLAVEVYKRGKYFNFYKKNNFSLMIAGAVGITAIVIKDFGDNWWSPNKHPKEWAHAAHWNIEKTMWRASITGRESEKGKIAGFAEGPHYFGYAFENLLPFFRTFSNYLQFASEKKYSFDGVIPNWLAYAGIGLVDYHAKKTVKNYNYDENYNNLYKWYNDTRLPNGQLPTYDNCKYHEYHYLNGLIKTEVGNQKTYNYYEPSENLYAHLLPDYIAIAELPKKPERGKMDFYFEESGDIILRTPMDNEIDNSHYIRISAEQGTATNGGGHENPDLGGIIIGAGEDYLAIDPPFFKWSEDYKTKSADHHNIILVDGDGPGKKKEPNDVEVIYEPYNSGNGTSTDEVTVKMSYENCDITRRVKMVSKSGIPGRNEDIYYYIVEDEVAANLFNKDLSWNLNGNGNINISDDSERQFETINTNDYSEVTWNFCNDIGFDGWNLYSYVGVSGGADNYTHITSSSSTSNNLPNSITKIHTRQVVEKETNELTKFVAILVPYKCDHTLPSITKSESDGKIIFKIESIDGVSIGEAMSFKKTSGLDTITGPFDIDTTAELIYNGNEMSFNLSSDYVLHSKSCDAYSHFRSASLKGGTRFKYDDTTYISSDVAADIRYSIIGKYKYSGYVDCDAEASVDFYLPDLLPAYQMKAINAETNENLNYTYDSSTQTISVDFDAGQTCFIFELTDPCLVSCFFPSTIETIDTLFDFNTGSREHLGHDLDITDSMGHLKITQGSKVDICENFVLVNEDSISMKGYLSEGDDELPVYTEYGENGDPIVSEGEKVVDDRLTTRKSMIIIRENAGLVLESGSHTHVGANSTILVKKGGTLLVKDDATLEIGNDDYPGIAEVIAEDGAYVCIEEDANILFYENENDTSDKNVFYIAMVAPQTLVDDNGPGSYNPNKTGAYNSTNSSGCQGKFLPDSLYYSNTCVGFCTLKDTLLPDGINNRKYGWANISLPDVTMEGNAGYCEEGSMKFNTITTLNEVYYKYTVCQYDTSNQTPTGTIYHFPDSGRWDTGRVGEIDLEDFNFSSGSSYRIRLYVLNDCDEIDSIDKVITISAAPEAIFELSGNCPGLGNILADGSSSSEADYHVWDVKLVYDYTYQQDDTNALYYSMQYEKEGAIDDSFDFPDFRFFGGYQYEISLTLYNDCGSSIFTDTIDIPLGVYIYPDDTMVYKDGIGDSTVVLNGEVSGAASFTWSPTGSLDDSTSSQPVATPQTTTTYILTASYDGCTDADTVTIYVNNYANAGPDTIICNGDSVQIGYSNMNMPVNYLIDWSPDSSLSDSSSKNPYAKPQVSTVYTLEIKDSSGTVIETDQVLVSVDDTLTAYFVNEFIGIEDDSIEVRFLNTTTPISSTSHYTWLFTVSTDSSKEVNPTFKYPELWYDSLYPVWLIAGNLCGIDTFQDTLAITGDTTLTPEQDIIYSIEGNYPANKEGYLLGNVPNPFRNETIIKYHISKGIRAPQLRITNSDGKVMKVINIDPNNREFILDWSFYTKGVYIYSLISNGKVLDSKRMIKQ